MNILAIVGLVLLVGVPSQAAEQETSPAHFVSVLYSVRPGYSRLTFGVEGKTHYFARQQGGTLKIFLSNTAVKSTYDGARLRFSSGLVDRVRIDQIAGDSATVVIQLKRRATFKVARDEQQKALYLTLYPDTTSAKPIAAPVVAAKQDAKASETRTTAAIQQSETPNSQSGFSWGVVVSIAIAIVLAALGTGLVLVFLRRSWRKSARIKNIQPVTATPTPGVLEKDHPVVEEMQPELYSVEESSVSPVVDQESSALVLAKQFRRGQGEMRLSFNLKGRQSEQQWSQLTKKLKTIGTGEQQQLKVARKLGIGRGEMELAMRLGQAKKQTMPKEEHV